MVLVLIPPPAAPGFLAAHGWGGAEILPLAGDASFRRYFRVVGGEGSAVLMDAPPEHEDVRPFLRVAEALVERGFVAPRILARDLEAGLLLIEDLGDDRMAEIVAAAPDRETPVYAAAIDLLLALHDAPAPADLAPYDRAVYQREAALFPEWYAPAVGIAVDAEGYRAAWDAVLDGIADPDPAVLVLRDYHAENIMLCGPGGETLALLDFQDALAGHPAYDLVSLLQDARRDVDPALEAAMLARYRAARPLDDAAYAVLGAQRNAKILGIFTRLWKRDGKPKYLSLQPRVWTYLMRDLEHPALAPVAAWFDANVPEAARAAHWSAGAGR